MSDTNANVEPNSKGKWLKLEIPSAATIDPRCGHSLINVPSKKKMYMIGGGNYDGELSEIHEIDYNMDVGSEVSVEYLKDILKCSSLEELGYTFTGRYEFMATLDKEESKIWIFGGADLTEVKKDICYIDLEEKKVVRIPEKVEDADKKPCGRTQGNNSSLIQLQGEDYLAVFGGGILEDDAVTDGNLYLFNTKQNSWSKVDIKGSIPQPVQGHGMVAIGSKIYIHGGMNKSVYTNDMYMIDMDQDEKAWSKILATTVSPCPRAAHGMCALGSDIYIYGGVDASTAALPDLWKFNTESREWVLLDTGLADSFGPEPRLDIAMTTFSLDESHNYLIIHGGLSPDDDENGKLYNDFWAYQI